MANVKSLIPQTRQRCACMQFSMHDNGGKLCRSGAILHNASEKKNGVLCIVSL